MGQPTKTKSHHFLLATMISIALTGCATTKGTRPEDMSAESHEEEAAKESARAEQHAQQYDANQFGWDFTEHGVEAQEHRQHAEDHRAAAAELRNTEEEACASVPPEARTWCPLLGPVVATEKTANGVRILLKDGANVEELVALIRCHIAYGNTQGREGMDRCPLYVKSVHVEQSGPNAIELTAKGQANVRELQERVANNVGD